MNIEKIKKQFAACKAAQDMLPPLSKAVEEIENLCRQAIKNQWGLCRMSKHGTVPQQVQEILCNINTPEEMRAELTGLQPLLKKAHEELTAARRKANSLRSDLVDSQSGALGSIASEFSAIKEAVFKKLVAALRPYTNEFNAQQLAKDTDVYKELEYRCTNLGAVQMTEPDAILSVLRSAISELEKYRRYAE